MNNFLKFIPGYRSRSMFKVFISFIFIIMTIVGFVINSIIISILFPLLLLIHSSKEYSFFKLKQANYSFDCYKPIVFSVLFLILSMYILVEFILPNQGNPNNKTNTIVNQSTNKIETENKVETESKTENVQTISPEKTVPTTTEKSDVIINNKIEQVKVTQIMDGDTICILNRESIETKIDFLGTDSPNKLPFRQPFSDEATNFIVKNITLNQDIFIETDEKIKENDGRLTYYVWKKKPTNFSEEEVRANLINAKILIEGFGKVNNLEVEYKYKDLFVKFEEEAKKHKKGLWK